MESEPILSLCSYSRYACGYFLKRHGSFLTLIICPAQDSDPRTMTLLSHCQPGPPLILPCCPHAHPKRHPAQNLNHKALSIKTHPSAGDSVAMCPVLLLSNLDSICSTINTSLSLGDRLSRRRNQPTLRETILPQWAKGPHLTWGPIWGLLCGPCWSSREEKKSELLTFLWLYSIWGHRRCTNPQNEGQCQQLSLSQQ